MTVNDTTGNEAPGLLVATFRVGEADYGLDAGRIQEVIRVDRSTAVAHAPDYVIGLINLRGKIVTLIDLGRKLGCPAPAMHDRRALILSHQQELLGLVVDTVSDVVEIPEGDIDPVCPTQAEGSSHFAGVCRNGGRLVTLLDPASVLAPAIREGR